MINRAFHMLSRNRLLLLFPLLFDLFSFVLGLFLFGFAGDSKFTFKLALHVGLPSISSVLDRNVMANGIQFHENGWQASSFGILMMIFTFLLTAYLQGGFIGLLHDAARRRTVTLSGFRQSAGRFFLRFLVVQIGLFAAILILGALLFYSLGGFGAILFLLVFLVVRILYIYFEFTMVADDLSPLEALSRARGYFRQRVPETSTIIGAIIGVSLVTSLIINLLWHPVVFLVILAAYDMVAVGLQLALMLSLHAIRQKEQPFFP